MNDENRIPEGFKKKLITKKRKNNEDQNTFNKKRRLFERVSNIQQENISPNTGSYSFSKKGFYNYLKSLKITFMPLDGKKPILNQWQKLTHESSKKLRIDDKLNYGILTGISFIVLDIDVKDYGLETWEELIKKNGDPNTFKVMTGSGGYHYYFKLDERTKNMKNITKINFNGKKVGLDIKNKNGQVVGPFSIHPDTKKTYKIVNGKIDKLIPMPDWCYNLFQVNNVGNKPQKSKIINTKTKRNKQNSVSENKQINNEISILSNEDSEVITLIENKYKEFEYRNKTTGIFDRNDITYYNFNRKSSSYCNICNKVHDRDNTLYGFKNDGNVYVGCIREKGKIKLTNENESKVELNVPKDWEKYIDKKIEKMPQVDILNYDIIILNGKMGMGKSEEFERCSNLPFFKEWRQISLACRKSLTDDKKSKNPKWIDYRLSKDMKDQYLIVQIESLYKLALKDKQKIFLHIDEIETVLAQLTSFTNMKKYKKVYAMFSYLMRKAQKILIADALLSQRTINIIKNIQDKRKVAIYTNTALPKDRSDYAYCVRTDFRYSNEAVFLTKFHEDLKKINENMYNNGSYKVFDIKTGVDKKFEKIAFATNNKSGVADVQMKYIEKKYPNLKVLYLNRDMRVEERDLLKDTSNLLKYDVIIYTPTIEVGYSLKLRGFDKMYGYFNSTIATYTTSLQMLQRIRDISTGQYHLYVENAKYKKLWTMKMLEEAICSNEFMLRMNEKEKFDLGNIMAYEYIDPNKVEYIYKDLWYHIVLNNLLFKLTSKAIYDEMFWYQRKDMGHIIVDINAGSIQSQTKSTPKILKEKELENEALRKETKKENAERLANANDIGQIDYENLLKKENNSSLTLEEQYQKKKYHLKTLYDVPSNIIDWKFVLTYQKPAVKQSWKYLTKKRTLLIRKKKEEDNVFKKKMGEDYFKFTSKKNGDDKRENNHFEFFVGSVNDGYLTNDIQIKYKLLDEMLFHFSGKNSINGSIGILVRKADLESKINQFIFSKTNTERITQQTHLLLSTNITKDLTNATFKKKLGAVNSILKNNTGLSWKRKQKKMNGKLVPFYELTLDKLYVIKNNIIKINI